MAKKKESQPRSEQVQSSSRREELPTSSHRIRRDNIFHVTSLVKPTTILQTEVTTKNTEETQSILLTEPNILPVQIDKALKGVEKKEIRFEPEQIVLSPPRNSEQYKKRQSMLAYSLNFKKNIRETQTRIDMLKVLVDDYNKNHSKLIQDIITEFRTTYDVTSTYNKFIRDNFKKKRSYINERVVSDTPKTVSFGTMKHLVNLKLEKHNNPEAFAINPRDRLIVNLLDKYDQQQAEFHEKVNKIVFRVETLDKDLKKVYTEQLNTESAIKHIQSNKECSLIKYQKKLIEKMIGKLDDVPLNKLKKQLSKIRSMNDEAKKFRSILKNTIRIEDVDKQMKRLIETLLKNNDALQELSKSNNLKSVTLNEIFNTKEKWLQSIGMNHLLVKPEEKKHHKRTPSLNLNQNNNPIVNVQE